MLYLLSAEIQTGKTRWLVALVSLLREVGVPVSGVVAPGVWKDHGETASQSPSGRYEKLGIDNVLLPQGEVVHLARRRDLAIAAKLVEPEGQSERAGLTWSMSDACLERVNEHLAWLECDESHGLQTGRSSARRGMYVVDELGRLELLRGEGLTHAVSTLARGPRSRWPVALAVVRPTLLGRAHELFDAPWAGRVIEISPGDDAASSILGKFEPVR